MLKVSSQSGSDPLIEEQTKHPRDDTESSVTLVIYYRVVSIYFTRGGSMGWYRVVWGGMGWYGVAEGGMGWYGVVEGGMGWYVVVWGGRGWYGVA